MVDIDFPRKIEGAMDTLTASERKVARALLADFPVAGLQTLVELAERANTSHPTVLRFIKKVGFPTYPKFQEALRREVQESYKTPWLRSLPEDQEPSQWGDQFNRLTAALSHNVASFLDIAPKTELHLAAQELKRCKGRTIVIGRNMTAPLAAFMYRCLRLAIDRVELAELQVEDLARTLHSLGSRDIVCVFHMPRYDAMIDYFCRQAKEKGVCIILFTDESLSPLASIADQVIGAPISAPTMFDSYTVTMIQIEFLLNFLIQLDPDDFRNRNNKVDELTEALKVLPAYVG